MRLSRHSMFMEIAHVIAQRGTCPRLCVGALVVVGKQIVSYGYNGAPAGKPHCTDVGCKTSVHKPGCQRTNHAEANCLKAVAPVYRNSSWVLYTTNSPCDDCTDVIFRFPVRMVYYRTPYRDEQPLIKLRDHGVGTMQIMPNGYLINPETGDVIEAD